MNMTRFGGAVVLYLFVLIALGCDRAQPDVSKSAPTDVTLGPRPEPEVLARAVDSLAARVVTDGIAPAFGVGVVMDSKTILARSYGLVDVSTGEPAGDRTLWYVASTSKAFTGFGVVLLAEQGVLKFDDPIATLVPHAQWPAGFDSSSVTLADFLGHTHGLGDRAITMSATYTGELPESEWPAMLRFTQLLKSRELEYSNLGYNVAAMVIDAKKPEGWRRFLDRAVFEPAGMVDTRQDISGIDGRRIARPHQLCADGSYEVIAFQKVDATMHSAGGHLATISDLARWINIHMENGILDGKQVFPSEAIALSHTMIARRKEPAEFAFFRRDGWAAGWDVGAYQGEPMISRFGSYSALRSHVSFLPRRHIGIVAQTNGEMAFEATDIIAAFAYDLERGDPEAQSRATGRLERIRGSWSKAVESIEASEAKRAARQKPLKRPMADFAGSYRNEQYGTITFAVRDGALHYQWGALSGGAEVLDAGQNALRIVIVDSGTSVTFDFPKSSAPAQSLELQQKTFVRQ